MKSMKVFAFTAVIALVGFSAPVAQVFVPAPQAMESFRKFIPVKRPPVQEPIPVQPPPPQPVQPPQEDTWLHGGTPGGGGCSVPGSISNLAVTAQGSTTLTVTFTEPSGSPTSYQWSNDGTTWASGPASGSISNATQGTDYFTFRIRGVNACGSGASSNIVSTYTYPASVITKSLQAVWDQGAGRSNPSGIQNEPNKTVGVDTLPSGCTLSSRTVTCTTAGVTFDRWAFPGYRLDFNFTGSATVTNTRFTINGQSQSVLPVIMSCAGGNPSISVSNSEYDGTGRAGGNPSFESAFYLGGCTNPSITTSRLTRDTQDYVTLGNGGTFSNNYVENPCDLNTGAGPHCEIVHLYGGTFTANQNLMNLDRWNNGNGGWTATLFNEGINSTITSTMNENIIYETSGLGGGYLIFISKNPQNVTANVSNNIGDSPGGSGSMFGFNGAAGETYATCTGNRKFDDSGNWTCP